MATEACLSLPNVCSEDHPETARQTDERCAEEEQLLNTTPERDEDGKRRRIVSQPSTRSQHHITAAAAAVAGGDGGGSGSGSGSGSGGGPGAGTIMGEEGSARVAPTCSSDTRRSAAEASSSSHLSVPDPEPLSQEIEHMLRGNLVAWGQRLIQLQPKVYLTEHLIECGLYLFKYLRHLQVEACCEGKFPLQYLSNQQLLIHDLVSCWWIALKHCSVRTAVPNRTLMCRATGTSPELLADRELAALIAVDWEVQAVLKQGGLVM